MAGPLSWTHKMNTEDEASCYFFAPVVPGNHLGLGCAYVL